MIDYSNEFLEHYGVKGMKWGVRRTKAQLAKARAERAKRRDPSTPEGAEIQRRKTAAANRRLLNDKDLDQLVDRLRKEQTLKELVDQDVSPGKKFVQNVLSSSGNKVAKGVVTTAGASLAGLALNRAFKRPITNEDGKNLLPPINVKT